MQLAGNHNAGFRNLGELYAGLIPAAQKSVQILLVAFYYLASKFGLAMSLTAEQVALIWPPTGIALAAVVLLGYRVWPAIMLGAFFANITASEPMLVALGVSIGNTLEALLGACMLRRFVDFNPALARLKDVWGIVFFAGVLSTMVSATIGVTSLCLGGLQPWSAFGFLWFIWWMGDAGGALVVAPVLLVWCTSHYERISLLKILEIFLLALGFTVYAIEALISPPPTRIAYFIFIFVIWAALRMGQHGTTLLTLAAAGVAIWATLHGIGHFASQNMEQSLIFLDTFMLTVAVSGLFLSAAIAERKETERRLKSSKAHMRLIFDSALDAVISIDKNGRITEWNKRAETMFGWAASEVMGKIMADIIIPGTYRTRHLKGFKRFLKEGTSKIMDKRVQMEALIRSGETIPIELTVTVQKNEDYFFTAFIRDMRLEKQAETTQNLLSAIVQSSRDAIISITLEGIITSWNAGAASMFGYIAKEAIGKNTNILIPPDRQEEARNLIIQAHEGKIIETFETVRITKSGRPIAVSLTVSPIRDADGKIIGASKILRDITDRQEATRKLQAAHKYLNDVLNHIPDPIFMKDRQHRWIGGNMAFWDFMGGPPEKFLGKTDYDFFSKEEADHFWERDDRVFNTHQVDICEDFFTDYKGERHILSTKKSAFLDEHNEQFLVGVFRDITALKKAEDKIQKYARELERSNQELDDFVYIASHDMKEPLRGLLYFSQFILEDYGSRLDDKGRQYIERLISLSKRMNQLIEDLLYYSRLGRAELAIQDVDPNIIVNDIKKILEDSVREGNVHIMVPRPMPHVVCDKMGMTEIFRNLITNAIKYNDKPDKKIEVGMLETAQSPFGFERNVFYVKDNGIGIDPKFHRSIFQIFKRLPESVRYNKTGSGVGLTFVKKIIERNKGHVWLESVPGEGSTFYFTLQG